MALARRIASSVLFEAQTAAENAMFAIAGLQRAANAADKASAILAKEAGANDPPSSSGGILFELRRLAENEIPSVLPVYAADQRADRAGKHDHDGQIPISEFGQV